MSFIEQTHFHIQNGMLLHKGFVRDRSIRAALALWGMRHQRTAGFAQGCGK